MSKNHIATFQNFYKTKNLDVIPTLLKAYIPSLTDIGMLVRNRNNFMHFFAPIFSSNPDKVAHWLQPYESAKDVIKTVIYSTLAISNTTDTNLLSTFHVRDPYDYPVHAPTKPILEQSLNSYNLPGVFAGFYATGESSYLFNIIAKSLNIGPVSKKIVQVDGAGNVQKILDGDEALEIAEKMASMDASECKQQLIDSAKNHPLVLPACRQFATQLQAGKHKKSLLTIIQNINTHTEANSSKFFSNDLKISPDTKASIAKAMNPCEAMPGIMQITDNSLFQGESNDLLSVISPTMILFTCLASAAAVVAYKTIFNAQPNIVNDHQDDVNVNNMVPG